MIKQAVRRRPKAKEWVARVPAEVGVLLWRPKSDAKAKAGIAKANLPAIIAKDVVRL